MLDTYRVILRKPGAFSFAWSGLLARLPMSMFNISVILMVQIQYDSYSMAGRVAAIGTLVWAAQTVPTARLVDRVGQRVAMIPLTVMFVIGAVIVVWTAMTRGPEWLLWVGVAVSSVSGPVGSLTRARWSHILKQDEIHTAFALEGALDEVLFIGGPALATILATVVWPPLGLVVCTISAIVGMTFLLRQTSTQPPKRSETGGSSLGFRLPVAVIAVAVIATALGLMFGAFDISAVAFADEHGLKSLSGVILAVLSVGSLLGGLYYGSRHWSMALWKRTVVFAGVLAVGFVALGFAPNLLIFSVIGFFAGATIAPTMTNIDSVVQRVVKSDQITEGMAWVRIGIGIGVAFGAWAAGWLIQNEGARYGLVVAAAAAVLVFVLALATIPLLKRGTGNDGEGERPSDPASDTLVEHPPVPPLA
ncbi:MFS transporter [Demequina sp.]|uniref:MFS transporter n=1 Tax=Demequina sp. TaxID=2050685 RepID=UPI003D0A10B8